MLADDGELGVQSGTLAPGVHHQSAWLLSLIDFIADQLPLWRDRGDRRPVMGETRLTSQLCAHLNSAAHKAAGWDILQFRPEEPDETVPARRIDLVPAPRGETIWIDDRRYSDFDPLLPIECKRLPTPADAGRDKRCASACNTGPVSGVIGVQ
ncbi:MAG TPA: hypothetical protein VES42_19235 [Pilimelia sp.]|nr:hypothetical protein [Pilimelia sp.]